MTPYPEWLWGLSWGYAGLAFLSGIIILADETRRPQKMFIMNLVWPITALYWGPFALWCYGKAGLGMTKQHHQQQQARRQRARRREDRQGGGQEQGGQQGRQEQQQSGGHQPQQTEPPANIAGSGRGMIIGFFFSYPANAFLLRKGWKERMG
jgi:hypothetical protein